MTDRPKLSLSPTARLTRPPSAPKLRGLAANPRHVAAEAALRAALANLNHDAEGAGA